VICSGFFLFITTLTLRSSIQIFNVTFLFLSTLTIGVLHTSDFYMYSTSTPTPLSFLKYYCVSVLWSNTTQIIITHIGVIFSRRTMSLSICSMVQLNKLIKYRLMFINTICLLENQIPIYQPPFSGYTLEGDSGEEVALWRLTSLSRNFEESPYVAARCTYFLHLSYMKMSISSTFIEISLIRY
jgi:hypothetical protein